LTLREDDRGLHFSALLDKSDPDAALLLRKVHSGLMDECSFAFRKLDQTWSSDRSEREITEVSLHRGDVSVVNFGANSNTPVSARSRLRDKGNLNLYQARARALALRDRDIRIRAASRNLTYYQAQAYAFGLPG
jgi:phage head maturation protease